MKYASKDGFVKDVIKEKSALDSLLAQLSNQQMCVAGVAGYEMDWSVKDMLAHLDEWHRLALTWFREGSNTETVEMPAPGYKWNQLRALNTHFFQKHSERPLNAIRAGFEESYKDILALIKSLSERQLLEPGHFPWTKKNPVITYFGANTASHYRWAMKRIKDWLRKSSKR